MSYLKFIVGGLCASLSVQAQICDFDAGSWSYTLTGSSSAIHILSSGSPDLPSSASYGVAGTNALVCSGGNVVLEMAPINTLSYPKSSFSFRLAANAEAGSGQGMDGGTDYVKVEWKTSATGMFTDVVKIKGYRNALWGMNDCVSHIEVACQNYEEISPFDSGYLPYGAPGYISIHDLPQDSSLTFRITLRSDRANETWSIDDLKCTLPVQWTNASGDRNLHNPLNWSDGQIPSFESALLISDTLSPQAPSDTLVISTLLTTAVDTLYLFDWKLKVGQWFHDGGTAIADTHLVVSGELGLGELTLRDGSVLGYLSMEHQPHSATGWRNMSVPLRTVWGDFTEDLSNAIYGSSGSIYGWDAGNASWFTTGSPSYTSSHPMTIYGGPNWMDSSNSILVKGKLVGPVDTAYLQYGIPSSNSPFGVSAGNEGWNLVANPYPFPIALDKLFSDVDFPSSLSPTAYLWSTKDQQYRSYNLTTGPSGGATNVIAPWQAFWVQLNSNPSGMLPLYIKAEHRSTPGGDVLRKSGNPRAVLKLNWEGGSRDLRIVDIQNASLAYQYKFDHKQRNEDEVEVYFESADSPKHRLALKSLDPLDVGGIRLVAHSDQAHTIELSLEEYAGPWWIENTITGEWEDLCVKNFNFDIIPGDTAVFRLWRANKMGVKERENQLNCEMPTVQSGELVNSSEEDWTLFDCRGEVVVKVNSGTQAVLPELFGVYILRSEYCSEKLFIDSTNP